MPDRSPAVQRSPSVWRSLSMISPKLVGQLSPVFMTRLANGSLSRPATVWLPAPLISLTVASHGDAGTSSSHLPPLQSCSDDGSPQPTSAAMPTADTTRHNVPDHKLVLMDAPTSN